ncbi:MAG: hypothetical protein ACKO85_13535 [Isosphaeraceae bacterium]
MGKVKAKAEFAEVYRIAFPVNQRLTKPATKRKKKIDLFKPMSSDGKAPAGMAGQSGLSAFSTTQFSSFADAIFSKDC